MSEAIYHKVQLGRESSLGTSVAATVVFPVEAGWLGFELDRASESPDEDFGTSDREQAGRSSTGVRGATASLPFVMSYQNFFHALEMHVAGSVTPTGTNPYTYVYPFDTTSITLKPYTMEYGDENSTQDEWEAAGVVANEMEIGFDALTAPGNSMWKCTLGLMSWTRVQAAMTGSLAAPALMETMEGHLTTLAEGSTATAFGSLSALTASLKQFSMRSTLNVAERAYGGATDLATGRGRSAKGEIEFDALIKTSATTLTNVHDIFNVAGSIPTERRWRIVCTGALGSLTIDARVRFTAVDLGDHEGERLYSVKGVFIKDSTLGSRGTITLVNAISAVP